MIAGDQVYQWLSQSLQEDQQHDADAESKPRCLHASVDRFGTTVSAEEPRGATRSAVGEKAHQPDYVAQQGRTDGQAS